jgi:hypothetical protein
MRSPAQWLASVGSPQPGAEAIPRLTIFAFLWACQALVHHEFFLGWVGQGDVAGWLVAIAAIGVLLVPSSLALFAAMLAASVIYNVRKWPFVVNHILVESLINLVIRVLLARAFATDPELRAGALRARERVFDSVAPILRSMLIAMYGFAILAKLNSGFLDPRESCVAVMYGDLLRRVPFLPDTEWARIAAIWGTLAIETAIPLCFAFSRTRLAAIAIGLPFHLMLGMIGHRTFSALAYAMYGLFVIEGLTVLVNALRDAIARRFAQRLRQGALALLRVAIPCGVATLIAAYATGNYREPLGPIAAYQWPWLIWGLWSGALMLAYGLAIAELVASGIGHVCAPVRWAHVMTAVLVANGLAPYLGLKTETAFAMYSNLRTEADRGNHFFLRLPQLADYQRDLVEIVSTDHPELEIARERGLYLTWFEFHRIASTAGPDFSVDYRRGSAAVQRFEKRGGVASDENLAAPLGWVSAKLLTFRPVSLADCPPCQH